MDDSVPPLPPHGAERAREAKVGYLAEALLVEQQVARLQVAVDEVTRVAKLKGFDALVDDELLVHRLENVGADHCMQVGFHVVKDQVDVAVVLSLEHILQTDDVLVVAVVYRLRVVDTGRGAGVGRIARDARPRLLLVSPRVRACK